MLDNTQHRMKELVCLNFRPGITWKERKQVIGKYIPANIDPWFYKLADIYLPFTQPIMAQPSPNPPHVLKKPPLPPLHSKGKQWVTHNQFIHKSLPQVGIILRVQNPLLQRSRHHSHVRRHIQALLTHQGPKS